VGSLGKSIMINEKEGKRKYSVFYHHCSQSKLSIWRSWRAGPAEETKHSLFLFVAACESEKRKRQKKKKPGKSKQRTRGGDAWMAYYGT